MRAGVTRILNEASAPRFPSAFAKLRRGRQGSGYNEATSVAVAGRENARQIFLFSIAERLPSIANEHLAQIAG